MHGSAATYAGAARSMPTAARRLRRGDGGDCKAGLNGGEEAPGRKERAGTDGAR